MGNLFSELKALPGRIASEFRQTFRSLLTNKNFRVYSTGQLISNAGTWMQSVALSWLVYKLTDSAVALGVVSFASYLPLLLLTYVGGMAADRFDRRKILMITQGLGAAQAVILATLTLTGTLNVPIVVGLALFLGCVTAMEVPTRQAFLSDLVDGKEMVNAISVNSAIFNFSRLSGPLLAGVVIASFGEAACFILNSLSFFVAIFTLSRVRLAGAVEKKEETAEDAARRKSLVKAALSDPRIRGTLMLAAVTSMFGFQYGVLLPVIVKQLLGGGASELGLLAACGGIGALVGALALASRGKAEQLSRGIGFGCLGLSVAITVIAFSHTLVLSAVAATFAGLCVSFQFSGGNSLLNHLVPAEVRGRMMGIFAMFQLGFTPFGGLLAGWTAQHLGLTPALLIAAAFCATAASFYLLRLPRNATTGGDDGG